MPVWGWGFPRSTSLSTVDAPGCIIFMENGVDLGKPHPKRPIWGLSRGSPVGWPWDGGSELRNPLTISSTSFDLISAQHTPRTRQEQKGRSIVPGHNAGGVAVGCCKGGWGAPRKMSFKQIVSCLDGFFLLVLSAVFFTAVLFSAL